MLMSFISSSYWNTRVVYNSETKDFGFKEVYYTKSGKIKSWTMNYVQVKNILPKHLKSALSKPVLLEKNEKLKEVLPKSKN
jgi:hypothetical protein